MRLVALALALTASALVLATGAQAKKGGHGHTLVVAPKAPPGPKGPGGPQGAPCEHAHFHSIQDAIHKAHPGDTVSVCAGTYVEGSGNPNSSALTMVRMRAAR